MKKKRNKTRGKSKAEILPLSKPISLSDENSTTIPFSLLRLKLSPGAFNMATYLCYLYDHVSRVYPPIEMLARNRKMSVSEATACEFQLLHTGFLIKNKDGTFSLMDK